MKKKYIFIIFSLMFLVFLYFTCKHDPDFVFTLYNPDKKIEINILDGGATTAKYIRVAVEDTVKRIYKRKIKSNVRAICTNQQNNQIYIIFQSYGINHVDTMKIDL